METTLGCDTPVGTPPTAAWPAGTTRRQSFDTLRKRLLDEEALPCTHSSNAECNAAGRAIAGDGAGRLARGAGSSSTQAQDASAPGRSCACDQPEQPLTSMWYSPWLPRCKRMIYVRAAPCCALGTFSGCTAGAGRTAPAYLEPVNGTNAFKHSQAPAAGCSRVPPVWLRLSGT